MNFTFFLFAIELLRATRLCFTNW